MMKRNTLISLLAVAIAAMAFPLSVAAYDFEEGGFYYNVSGSEATVTYRDKNTGDYSGNVVIPESVTHNGVTYAVTAIGPSAFSRSSNLTSVEISKTIKTIGDHAFNYCSGLTSVVVPNSVESLGRCVFHSCSGLRTAVVGNSVPLIDEYEFQYCYSLAEVVIGESVTHLAIKTFFDCPSLRKVTCLAPVPPTMYAYYSFCDEAYTYATLYVPGASMQAYKNDQNWGRFRSYQNMTPAEHLSLDKTSLTLHGDESQRLVATVLPADASQALRWMSSDESVATVSQGGLVYAVATGYAIITATTTDGTDLSATCNVRVLSNGVQTNNMLTIPEMLTVEKGKPFELPIGMVNNAAISALQFDLSLPEGIELASDGDNYLIDLLDSRVTPGHAVYARALSDGAIRVIVSSSQSEAFIGNDGDLMVLHLNVGDELADGFYNVLLTNIVLADADAMTYYAPDELMSVEVKSYMKGDANGDGLVNVGDYVTVANYILGLNPDPFIFSAADVDENGMVDVGDLVGVANIVLGDFDMPQNAPHHDNDVTLNGESVTTGEGRVIVTLNMDNEMALAALQMDIELPEGMTLAQANLSSRASHHSLAVNRLNDGSMRLLASSNVNDVVDGNEGALLTLVLEGSTSDNAAVNVSDVLLAEADMTTHGVSPFSISIGNSAVKEVRSDVQIYAQGSDIIVVTPTDTAVELIATNGITRVVKAQAGVNTYRVERGIWIVRATGQVVKVFCD